MRAGDVMSDTRCIAISRQQGSGGSYIGRAVAERLGFRYFDREMLRTVAEYLREHEHDSKDEPRAESWFDRLGAVFSVGTLETGYVPPSPTVLYLSLIHISEPTRLLSIS